MANLPYRLALSFSSLYPLDGHFCAVHLTDGTKTYRPESQIVLDLDTTFGFFGGDRAKSLARIASEVESLCDEWNLDNKEKVIM